MRIYLHTGKGHYIGSAIVVLAKDDLKASEVIRKTLDSMGLKNEPLSITSSPVDREDIIYAVSGDY